MGDYWRVHNEASDFHNKEVLRSRVEENTQRKGQKWALGQVSESGQKPIKAKAAQGPQNETSADSMQLVKIKDLI